jgi:hypothetical protein
MDKYYFVESGEPCSFGDKIIEEDVKDIENGYIQTTKVLEFNENTVDEFIKKGVVKKVENKTNSNTERVPSCDELIKKMDYILSLINQIIPNESKD